MSWKCISGQLGEILNSHWTENWKKELRQEMFHNGIVSFWLPLWAYLQREMQHRFELWLQLVPTFSCEIQGTWCTFVRHGLDLGDQCCTVLRPHPGGCARNSFLCLSEICGVTDPWQQQRMIKRELSSKTQYLYFLQGAWCLSGCSPIFTSSSCM